ncbi:MAG TPA: hypothetical protein VMH39_12040 [Gemmatimonadaceae bacterium]|nr:hypothetical protein [Gemmatimonadaceae bacterium]
MWSDTILTAERQHFVRLCTWGVASLLIGAGILLSVARRPARVPLLATFARGMAILGGLEVLAAAAGRIRLQPPSLETAVQLERWLWFAAGCEFGVAAVAAAIVIWALVTGRRLGTAGAALAICLHGLTVATLGLPLIAIVSR